MRLKGLQFADADESRSTSTTAAGLCRHLREKYEHREMPREEALKVMGSPFASSQMVQDTVLELRVPPRRREANRKFQEMDARLRIKAAL